jgi:hypothetical protein
MWIVGCPCIRKVDLEQWTCSYFCYQAFCYPVRKTRRTWFALEASARSLHQEHAFTYITLNSSNESTNEYIYTPLLPCRDLIKAI